MIVNSYFSTLKGRGILYLIYKPRREKTYLWEFANNKGADQPANLCSLINAFVFRLLENIISDLDTNKISIF